MLRNSILFCGIAWEETYTFTDKDLISTIDNQTSIRITCINRRKPVPAEFGSAIEIKKSYLTGWIKDYFAG